MFFVPHFPLPVLSGSPPFWFNSRLLLPGFAVGLDCGLFAPVCHYGEWKDSIIDNYERRSPAWPFFVAPEKA